MNVEEDLAIALADLSPSQLAAEYEARCGYSLPSPALRRIPDSRIARAARARWSDVAPFMSTALEPE